MALIVLVIMVAGFSLYYGVSTAAGRAAHRRVVERDTSGRPRLTEAEQAQVLGEVNAMNAATAYGVRRASGRTPRAPFSIGRTVGTALFAAEVGHDVWDLAHHQEDPEHGFHPYSLGDQN